MVIALVHGIRKYLVNIFGSIIRIKVVNIERLD